MYLSEMWGISLLWGKISITSEAGVRSHAGAELGELAAWLRLLGAEVLIRQGHGNTLRAACRMWSWVREHKPDHGVQNRNCSSWAQDHSFACSIGDQMSLACRWGAGFTWKVSNSSSGVQPQPSPPAGTPGRNPRRNPPGGRPGICVDRTWSQRRKLLKSGSLQMAELTSGSESLFSWWGFRESHCFSGPWQQTF